MSFPFLLVLRSNVGILGVKNGDREGKNSLEDTRYLEPDTYLSTSRLVWICGWKCALWSRDAVAWGHQVERPWSPSPTPHYYPVSPLMTGT